MEKQPLRENYERLFGAMQKISKLGIKEGRLSEAHYFDDSVEFGIKVSLRQASEMSYVYKDSLRSLGIQEDATDQYIAPDEDSFFDMMYAIIENGIEPQEFVEVVINGKSMSGKAFIQEHGHEFGWDGAELNLGEGRVNEAYLISRRTTRVPWGDIEDLLKEFDLQFKFDSQQGGYIVEEAGNPRFDDVIDELQAEAKERGLLISIQNT